MSVLAIVPAAGTGIRMGGGTPKQFLSLDGVPIFVHTLRKFAASEAIDEIFLGVRPEEMDRAFSRETSAAISQALKRIGFTYVALDLEGYRQGSLNEMLPQQKRS